MRSHVDLRESGLEMSKDASLSPEACNSLADLDASPDGLSKHRLEQVALNPLSGERQERISNVEQSDALCRSQQLIFS
jgi:hypothetical protein